MSARAWVPWPWHVQAKKKGRGQHFMFVEAFATREAAMEKCGHLRESAVDGSLFRVFDSTATEDDYIGEREP